MDVACYEGMMGPIGAPLVDAAENFEYNVVYSVNGENYTVGSHDPAITLDANEYLPAGHVWTDGSKYYAGGSTLTFTVKGRKTLTAIPGTSNIDAGGGRIYAATENFTLTMENGATSDVTRQVSCAEEPARMSYDITITVPTGSYVPPTASPCSISTRTRPTPRPG